MEELLRQQREKEAAAAAAAAPATLPVRLVRDPVYEDKINALIEKAEVLAREEVGIDLTGYKWTEAFHRHLDLLAYDAGLRTASWIAIGGARPWPRTR